MYLKFVLNSNENEYVLQVTAAQVEIYPTKTSSATTEHMDSSHSASPTTTWNSRKQTSTNNMRETDPAHGRSEGRHCHFYVLPAKK